MGLSIEELSHIGTVVAAICAAFALVLAYLQIRHELAIQREILARQAYHGVLKLAVDHPVLARGDMDEIHKLGLSEKYRWYFASLLLALEDIAIECGPDENWLRLIRFQLGLHRAYLNDTEFRANHYPLLYVTMREIVDELVAGR